MVIAADLDIYVAPPPNKQLQRTATRRRFIRQCAAAELRRYA